MPRPGSHPCRPWRPAALAGASALALALAACGGAAPGGAAQPASTAARRTRAHHARRVLAPPLRRGRYRGPVPILMYHVMSAPPAGTPYPALWTDPALFRAQMHALAAAGYHGVTLAQVDAAWHGGRGLPRRPVVVSFDDGYHSQVTHAAPVLRRLGWRGVFFLEVHNVGRDGISRRDVRRLIADGGEIDAHTITHPDLTTLDAAGLRHEVAGSRRILRRMFGVPVAFFAYPAGRYDAAAEAAVRAAGFRAAVTTEPGVAQPGADAAALPRIRVDGGESPAAVLASVAAVS